MSVGRHDRYSHLAMAAAKIALKDGALDTTAVNPKRFGVLVGSGVGGLQAVETSCEILMTKVRRQCVPTRRGRLSHEPTTHP
eukprot:6206987-Pleurochrysis_carterae.AAC.2